MRVPDGQRQMQECGKKTTLKTKQSSVKRTSEVIPPHHKVTHLYTVQHCSQHIKAKHSPYPVLCFHSFTTTSRVVGVFADKL